MGTSCAFIVDSSVAIKWAIPESGSDLAARLWSARLLAPDLMRIECANVLWRLVARYGLPRDEAVSALEELTTGPIVYHDTRALERDALELALALDHPVYDCCFLALARREGIPLVTEDRRLAGVVGRAPQAGVAVLTLAEAAAGLDRPTTPLPGNRPHAP
ncbi:type II toxin-antitoxin system VapC family toxin [Azospirillum thermophilum]|uniref:Ribonuclease VapC n=1 Tax=Azospirillum thermophilum TaxID=2202148 RepID=A0A2S2CSI4_9PROT|nr:type II toxin-antitoxin system VapC family toxin [Azospirillum thermophilum]AWK87474.1 VapC toxin family PIN domain ribonuclease [Azospirillum thermophilum]